jgi:hypothetical protein
LFTAEKYFLYQTGKRASAPLPSYFLAFSLSLSKPAFTSSHTLQRPSRLKFRPLSNFYLSDKQTMLSTSNKRPARF